jgi:hypothetical protein
MVFTKHLSVLVSSVVVFKGNLGIVEERGTKDKSVLALVKDKQRLVIYYLFNVNFNVFAGLIKHPNIP